MKPFVLAAALAALGASCLPSDTESDYLFGLTEADILEIRDRYAPQQPDELALDRLRAPFDCSRFGQLCRFLDRDSARNLVEREVDLALEGVAIEEIDGVIDASIREFEPASDSRVWSTSTTRRYIDSQRRVKITYGTVYPLIGTAHSRCKARYQERPRTSWKNRDAAWLYCRTDSHISSSWRYGSLSDIDTYDHKRAQNELYEVGVIEARAYHARPAHGWGHSVSGGSDYYNTIVQTRVYVQVTPKGASSATAFNIR